MAIQGNSILHTMQDLELVEVDYRRSSELEEGTWTLMFESHHPDSHFIGTVSIEVFEGGFDLDDLDFDPKVTDWKERLEAAKEKFEQAK